MREFAICMLILWGLIAWWNYESKPTVQEQLDTITVRLDKIEYLIIMNKPYEKEVLK